MSAASNRRLEVSQPPETIAAGMQLWVNLRAKDKSAKPGYQTLLKAQIPTVELP
ncbi:MAG TPA: hypothetical protein VHG71_01975 [Verrucomicrobiae bacterium]|nr:hypothetical protein [Verrucomicrobiae bacterium]